MSHRSIRPTRPNRSLLLALIASAGAAMPISASTPPDAVLDDAATLITLGRTYEAREMLTTLVDDQRGALSGRESARAFELLGQASRRLSSTAPGDVSLQKAEAALRNDDLVGAAHHARDAARRGSNTAKSEAFLRYIESRRSVVAPYAIGSIDQAQAAYDAGRYAEAKRLVDSVAGWGVELPLGDRTRLEDLRSRIVGLEQTRGAAFDTRTSLAVMQPGVVRRRNNQPQSEPAPEATPAETTESTESQGTPLRDLPPPPRQTSSGNNTPPPPNIDELLREFERQAPPPPSIPVTQPATPAPAQTVPAPAPQPTTTAQPAIINLPPPPRQTASGSQVPPRFVPQNAQPSTAPSQPVVVNQPATTSFTPAPSPIGAARSQEADALLRQADAAYDSRRLNEAAALYQRLTTEFLGSLSSSDLARVNANLAEARTLIASSAGPAGDPIDLLIEERELVRQQKEAEFNNLMGQARQSLSEGDTIRASELAINARVVARGGRDYFSESQLGGLESQVDEFLAEVDVQDEIYQRELADQQDKEREGAARLALQNRQRDKQRKITESLERVRALQMEMKYAEALQVVDQILFLDPVNPAGLVLKDVIYNTKVMTDYQRIQSEKRRSFTDQGIANEAAIVAPGGLVNYPSDWPSISVNRLGSDAGAEPPENRAVIAQLEDNSKRFPVQFADNALIDVLDFFEKVTQLNMQVQWASLEEIGIERDTPISLNFKPVTAQTVLNSVLEAASAETFGEEAGWAVRDGILYISSDEDLRRNTTLEIYDVRDLIIEVPDYNEAPDFDLNSVLSSQGGGQSPFQDQGNDEAFDFTPIEERVQEISDIISSNVDVDGWQINGGDTGTIQPYSQNGQLIITNTPKNHREIRSLLSKLRQVRAMQINVETRFLIVSQSFFEQIGFDLDVYFNTNGNQVRFAREEGPTPDATIQGGDFFNFSQGGLLRTVTGAQLDTDGDGTVDQQITQGVVNPRSWSPIGAASNSFGLATALAPQEGITATILQNAPALGIAGQFLDDIQVDFLIQATQADTRSVTLTAPRLTFTNGQTANIYVATQTSFVSDLQPVVSDSAVGFDPTLDVISEGVRLLVEGTISGDRRYVTLNVDAAVAEVTDFATQAVTAVAGGQLVSSADTSSFIQLPQATVTRVQTTVTVPDQGTILLGGQRLVSESEVETGVPVLSKIPILNRFFSNRIESKEEQTLLILLKPTILIQNENEERDFPGLLDSLRTGFGG